MFHYQSSFKNDYDNSMKMSDMISNMWYKKYYITLESITLILVRSSYWEWTFHNKITQLPKQWFAICTSRHIRNYRTEDRKVSQQYK